MCEESGVDRLKGLFKPSEMEDKGQTRPQDVPMRTQRGQLKLPTWLSAREQQTMSKKEYKERMALLIASNLSAEEHAAALEKILEAPVSNSEDIILNSATKELKAMQEDIKLEQYSDSNPATHTSRTKPRYATKKSEILGETKTMSGLSSFIHYAKCDANPLASTTELIMERLQTQPSHVPLYV